MKAVLILILVWNSASAASHSLKYVLSASSGASTFPEFLGYAVVDGVEVGYCDSNTRRVKPKTPWMTKLLEEDHQHQRWLTEKCIGNYYDFKATIVYLMQRFNQSEAVHIFQRMNGCSLDDETGDFGGFNNYGYDGEDLISFDLKTLTWIASKPQAVITKHNWDIDGDDLFWKYALTIDCKRFLQTYVTYKKSSVQTVLPSVSLLQRTPSSPVTCHATGFYPDTAKMFWRKDGEETHEGVVKGEVLPNNNETFQMRADLNISSFSHDDWRKYDCVFQLSGVKDDVIIKLDAAVIKTNHVPGYSPFLFVGLAVSVLLLFFCCNLVIRRICCGDKFLPVAEDEEKKEEGLELAVRNSPGDLST